MRLARAMAWMAVAVLLFSTAAICQSPSEVLEKGVALRESGQHAKAIEVFREAIRLKPDYVEVWYNLGFAYGNSGQYAKAIESYREAIRLRPDYADAWYNLGVMYVASGDRSEPKKVYEKLRELDLAKAEEFFNEVILP